MRRTSHQGLIATSTAAAAFLVHRARDLVVPEHLPMDSHGYLAFAPDALVLVLALSIGLGLRAAAQRLPAGVRVARQPLALWALCSVALLAIFGAQELIEGHSAALLTGSGVTATLPLAAGFGALLALLLHRGKRTIAAFARVMRRRLVAALPRPVRTFSSAAPVARAPRSPLCALLGAGRAPPLTIST